MHGASAVAEVPNRLEKVFLNNSLRSTGIYGFQFYVLGVPTTITIDDHLPLDSSGNAVFAKVSDDGALWGPLLEKAFAKLQRLPNKGIWPNTSYPCVVGSSLKGIWPNTSYPLCGWLDSETLPCAFTCVVKKSAGWGDDGPKLAGSLSRLRVVPGGHLVWVQSFELGRHRLLRGQLACVLFYATN